MAKKQEQKVKQFPKPVKGEKKPVLLASPIDVEQARTALLEVGVRLEDLRHKVEGGLKVTKRRASEILKTVATLSKRVAHAEDSVKKAQEREEQKAKRSLERKAKTYLRAIDQVNEYRKLQGLPPLDLNGKEAKIA